MPLWQLIKKIRAVEDSGVELIMSQNSPLLENLLAFKIIKKEAESFGKSVKFNFEDKNFSFLNEALNPIDRESSGDNGNNHEIVSSQEVLPVSKSTDQILTEKSKRGLSFRPKVPKLHFNLRAGLIIPGLAILFVTIVLGLIGSYIYFVPRTRVVLTVDSEPLVRTIDVTASATASAGVSNSVVIPALEIAATAKKSESTPSSGKKDVGEKAAGEVTVYNKTASSINLPAGTVITHGRVIGDDLRFTTNAAVTVPARSSNPLSVSGYDPGTVNVGITAESFGEDYNLASGDTFPVGTRATSDFIAQNSAAFVGGTRRQTVVVTATDQKVLLDSLTTSLKDELKATLLAKLVSGQNIDDSSVIYNIVSKSFDHGVGEEAPNLALTLEMSSSVMAFSQNELKNAVYSKLLTYVPDGYQLFGNEQDVELNEAKASGKVLKISARGKGFIVPKVDLEEVKRNLLGKTLADSEKYLGSLSNISSHEIQTPIRIGPFSFLPLRPDSLKVEVVRR